VSLLLALCYFPGNDSSPTTCVRAPLRAVLEPSLQMRPGAISFRLTTLRGTISSTGDSCDSMQVGILFCDVFAGRNARLALGRA
jgi:hypothetical protein